MYKTEALWDWFTANAGRIKSFIEQQSDSEREYIVNNLNTLILDLGNFSWDIETGRHTRWMFIISPNRDRELLEKSIDIINAAPVLEDWEFHYCKPPKNWDRKIIAYDDFMNELNIDASGWNFVLLPKGEHTFSLLLEAENTRNMDQELIQITTDTAVIHEIGEEILIRNITSITVTSESDPSFSKKKRPFAQLKEQIENLLL